MISYDYLLDKSHFKDMTSYNPLQSKKLYYRVYHNAYISPSNRFEYGGGVITNEGEFIENTSIHVGLGGAIDIENEKIEKSYSKILYIGYLYHTWGHFITDGLSRFWFIQNSKLLEEFRDVKWGYITANNEELSKNYWELLSILGIEKDRLMHIKQTTQFKEVIVLDQCFWGDNNLYRYFTKEYVSLIDKIREYGEKNFIKLDNDKYFLTYSTMRSLTKHGVKFFGEEKLVEFFKNLGYSIIAPEKCSFKEQLNIFLNCKCFASTIGSASHNSIFLRDGASAYFITRCDTLTYYQVPLCNVNDIESYFIDSNLSVYCDSKNKEQGPYYFYVSDNLKKAFNINITAYKKKNFEDFTKYRRISLLMHNSLNPPKFLIEELKNELPNEYKNFHKYKKYNEGILSKSYMKYVRKGIRFLIRKNIIIT